MVNKSFYYLTWVMVLFLGVSVCLAGFIFFVYYGLVLSVSFDLGLVSSGLGFECSFLLNPISLFFSFVVLLITLTVLTFSLYYIGESVLTGYFVWLNILFVLSMLFVINMSTLPLLILGWDGLGVVSFFLIIFYQNEISIYSGVFTIMINRLGDGILMICIPWVYFFTPFDFFVGSLILTGSLSFFLGLGFITNSALFPFSSWLPAAIAAPTPISSLVHSSTLVTAGLYLMIRFSGYLYSSDMFILFLLISSVFTSFYAGMNSLVEVDLKNVVALSTLSHLGFIGLSFSSGYVFLSFFHLISHAFFKSVLFMSVGNLIMASSHYQESRYISSVSLGCSYSSSVMVVSVFSLVGVPFLSGFYSNDIILEFLGVSNLSSFLVVLVYLNLFFTYVYSIRLFQSVWGFSKFSSYSSCLNLPLIYLVFLCFLALVSVVSCSTLIWTFYPLYSISLPLFVNFYPLFFSISILFFYYVCSYWVFNWSFFNNKILISYFSSIMFLTAVLSPLSSNWYFSVSSNLAKSFELGLLSAFSGFSFSGFHYFVFSFLSPIVFKVFSWVFLVFLFVFVLL